MWPFPSNPEPSPPSTSDPPDPTTTATTTTATATAAADPSAPKRPKAVRRKAKEEPADAVDVASRAYPKDYKKVFANKTPSKMVDPCNDARKASMKCLDRNGYDKDMCTDYFDMYKDCRKRWMEQMKADRRAGNS